MPAYRYFTPDELEEGQQLTLDRDQARHLQRAFRQRAGEEAELVNGRGALAHCRVLEGASLAVESVERRELVHRLVLVQGIARPSHLSDIVEKGTELGVTHFQLFPAERSERESVSELSRLERIAIAAMKQCGRLYLPTIEVAPLCPQELPLFYGDPSAEGRLGGEDCAIVIGPEGGFSSREEALLQEWGATGVRLHPHVLRTETAAIVAAATVSGHWTTPL